MAGVEPQVPYVQNEAEPGQQPAALLEAGLATAVALSRTLRAILHSLGPQAISPVWNHATWAQSEPSRPAFVTLSQPRVEHLRILSTRARREIERASRARLALQHFLHAHRAPAIVVEIPDLPPAPHVITIDLDDDEPQQQQQQQQPPARAPSPVPPPAPERSPELEQQLEDAKDLESQLSSLCYAMQRVQPVLDDGLQLAECNDLERTDAEVELLAPDAKFTCPVCLDDDVSVQDAFAVSHCGHRVCRPCALRLVDHNIKQMQPQLCPRCQGEPCPRCPITLHDIRKQVTERCDQRHRERVEACAPRPHARPYLEEGHWSLLEHLNELGPADRRPAVFVGDDDQQDDAQGPNAAPDPHPPPKVKHCCMTQADMRLLLQPEELQQLMIQRRERKKRRREKKKAQEALAAAAAVATQPPAKRRKQNAAGRGMGLVIDLSGSQDQQPAAAAGPNAARGKKGRKGAQQGRRVGEAGSSRQAPVVDLAASSDSDSGGGGSSSGEEEEGWGDWSGEGPPPTYEAYLKAEALRAAHGEQLFQLCPKCGEGVELEEGSTRLHCPSCKADKCVSCGVDWHEGSTCEKYQEWARENAQADEAFKKLAESGEVKMCPQCGQGITKIDGCHHMTCTRCGCKFCYRCGAKKSGRHIQTHGCDCMNGAAWEHDPRAQVAARGGAGAAAGAARGAAAAGAGPARGAAAAGAGAAGGLFGFPWPMAFGWGQAMPPAPAMPLPALVPPPAAHLAAHAVALAHAAPAQPPQPPPAAPRRGGNRRRHG